MSILKVNSNIIVEELIAALNENVFGTFALYAAHDCNFSQKEIVTYFVEQQIYEHQEEFETFVREKLSNKFNELLGELVSATITAKSA